ncbi:LCP family protein [Streptomyces sp. TS71-3]|uniref:LCP family protein n=1 Tax=Streptomyces sp. TS71-3 TaxID=2733862 RepID=UPI001B1A7877|nr:LCP family protein [Streptomyces sp. TS71-3]GHJ36050.1 transcriptional regulator [Streptomyces sp. TS71-3]
MAYESTADSSDGRGPRRRKSRSAGRKALLATAWAAAGLVLLGGGGLGYVYFKLNGNLSGVDINTALGKHRPKNVDNGSMDILVLGSDSRSGANAAYGGGGGTGARSDTAMVVHVYKGHKRASVVSIPRDTLVTRPDCTASDGSTVKGGREQMFNSAYAAGGPACAVKTVEAMSGIRMDHFVEVDFTGFKKLVDTLGGVPVTTRKAIDDDKSHLHLAPGTHTLNGEQALGLVRTRHGVGDGSDLGRIELQQAFVRALINQVRQVGVISDPAKLYDLADTATSAMTTDSELASVKQLAGFAGGFKGISSNGTTMVTLPVAYDPHDANRVLPLAAQDRQVWAALKGDKPVPASATKGSAAAQGSAGRVVTGG